MSPGDVPVACFQVHGDRAVSTSGRDTMSEASCSAQFRAYFDRMPASSSAVAATANRTPIHTVTTVLYVARTRVCTLLKYPRHVVFGLRRNSVANCLPRSDA